MNWLCNVPRVYRCAWLLPGSLSLLPPEPGSLCLLTSAPVPEEVGTALQNWALSEIQEVNSPHKVGVGSRGGGWKGGASFGRSPAVGSRVTAPAVWGRQGQACLSSAHRPLGPRWNVKRSICSITRHSQEHLAKKALTQPQAITGGLVPSKGSRPWVPQTDARPG